MTQPADNPFELLGVDKRFDLDEQALHQAFLRATAQAHPDRATDPDEQMALARRAAAINAAYEQLKEPARRAEALVRLHGGPTASDDKSLPDGLLMEMLEIREQMDQAQSEHDQARLNELRTWAQDQRMAYLQHIGQALSNPSPTAQQLAEARTQLNALRYIDRMIEQLDPNYDPNDELS
jgi:molecular chaperone HscB